VPREIFGMLRRLAIPAVGAFIMLPAAGRIASSTSYCSIDPFGVYSMAGQTLFIATASRDSVKADKPARRVSTFRDTVSLAGPRYAQIVTLDRIGASAAPELLTAARSHGGKAVLVPWVYGPDCAAGTWDGQALWLEPGSQGLFGGKLRPRADWLDGLPTFDVGSPYNVPYPSGRAFSFRLRKGNALSAGELMSFYDSLPRVSDERTDRLTQMNREQKRREAIIRWAQAHPDLADRPPVAEMITLSRRLSRMHPFDVKPSPLAGTWRFAIWFPGHDTVVAYGRSEAQANSLMTSARGSDQSWDLDRSPPFGYYLLLKMTKSPADLEIDGWPPPTRQAYLSASFEPEASTRDSTVWYAGAEVFGATAILPDTASVREQFAAMRFSSHATGDTSRPRYAPGRIVTRPDGSARLEIIYRSGGEILAAIRAERISTKVWVPR
jgi:hypothetical protein